MGLYDNIGSVAGYKKNNKEREELDYYATPPWEVTNILEKLELDFTNKSIIDTSLGGGHLIQGVLQYIDDHNQKPIRIYGTDIKDRGYEDPRVETGYGMDTLADNYIMQELELDYVIINPPYSTIEPHVIRALQMAKEGVILLARLQFLESVGRYENIFKIFPPTEIYVYVDRIKCYKNADFTRGDAIQAYAWFYWGMKKDNLSEGTKIKWIRRTSSS